MMVTTATNETLPRANPSGDDAPLDLEGMAQREAVVGRIAPQAVTKFHEDAEEDIGGQIEWIHALKKVRDL